MHDVQPLRGHCASSCLEPSPVMILDCACLTQQQNTNTWVAGRQEESFVHVLVLLELSSCGLCRASRHELWKRHQSSRQVHAEVIETLIVRRHRMSCMAGSPVCKLVTDRYSSGSHDLQMPEHDRRSCGRLLGMSTLAPFRPHSRRTTTLVGAHLRRRQPNFALPLGKLICAIAQPTE